MYKLFGSKYHRGYICDFDNKERYYKVRYEDGDSGEYDESKIATMLHKPDKNNMRQALAATRYEREEAAYVKTQSAYTPPSKFSARYAKAMAQIEMNLCNGIAYANVVVDEEFGKAMEYQDLLKDERYREVWSKAGVKEYGRLFQGYGKNKDGTKENEGTDTYHWIPRSQVPRGKKLTYARTVVDIQPEKDDPNRVRITVEGDQLEYFGETSSETAKILTNSVLSTKNAKFMSIDIINFYIQTDLSDYQYIHFYIDMITQAIIDGYNINTIVEHDGWCYTKIRKAMYGLKELLYLINLELKQILAEEAYVPSKFTPGLFTHKTRDIAFSLVEDDFGVKYTNREDAENFAVTIKKRYSMKCC